MTRQTHQKHLAVTAAYGRVTVIWGLSHINILSYFVVQLWQPFTLFNTFNAHERIELRQRPGLLTGAWKLPGER